MSELKTLVDEYKAEADRANARANQMAQFLTVLIIRLKDNKNEVRISQAELQQIRDEQIQMIPMKKFVKLIHVQKEE